MIWGDAFSHFLGRMLPVEETRVLAGTLEHQSGCSSESGERCDALVGW